MPKSKDGVRKSSDDLIQKNMAYNSENVTQIKLALNKQTDSDIINHLNKQPKKQTYIKMLIRADMEGGGKGET